VSADRAADTLLRLHSLAGEFSSNKPRFDVMSALEGAGMGSGSPFVLELEPSETEATAVTATEGEGGVGEEKDIPTDLSGAGAAEKEKNAVPAPKIVILCNPLSLAGQRAAALAKLVRDDLRLPLTLVLTPSLEVTEFPLQNFYRFADGHGVSSSGSGSGGGGGGGDSSVSVLFSGLPRMHTLTLHTDHPEMWNVQASSSSHDLDNLECPKKTTTVRGDKAHTAQGADGSDVNASVEKGEASVCGDDQQFVAVSRTPWLYVRDRDTSSVSFSLKNLLIAGQCFEGARGGERVAPNGLQLQLQSVSSSAGTEKDADKEGGSLDFRSQAQGTTAVDMRSDRSDTLVMKNLGYFQLAADAGLWRLGLAPGRGRQIFFIDPLSRHEEGRSWSAGEPPAGQLEATAHLPALEHLAVPVRSFRDAPQQLYVQKRPGMGDVQLQAEEEPVMPQAKDQGIFSSFWKSKHPTNTEKKERNLQVEVDGSEDGKIHVFSLATGRLYERLLRIMMLSVTRKASMPVKFWLFENYLSPRFKESAAKMAETYGFELAYVTYKWPEWLHAQTDKQRIIWGYKILFLDVLFPLNVKKVIYVDADQVVRADLKELWDHDLEGKPYAYTPFCTSRKETLGFQFWRAGYWKNHLGDNPYHISALYVVDLVAFRRFAVGDTLRSVYDMLARDSNSLANLDQDLPNYAQHNVPIHSLPQEWLWCETWCSDASKAKVRRVSVSI
jgi:UDP-glucose:glycoprotein glucosyltransferase